MMTSGIKKIRALYNEAPMFLPCTLELVKRLKKEAIASGAVAIAIP